MSTRPNRNAVVLTRAIAFAAGADAANRNMRARWPRDGDAWTEEDYNIAAARTNALLKYVPISEGGLLFPDGSVLDPETGIVS